MSILKTDRNGRREQQDATAAEKRGGIDEEGERRKKVRVGEEAQLERGERRGS